MTKAVIVFFTVCGAALTMAQNKPEKVETVQLTSPPAFTLKFRSYPYLGDNTVVRTFIFGVRGEKVLCSEEYSPPTPRKKVTFYDNSKSQYTLLSTTKAYVHSPVRFNLSTNIVTSTNAPFSFSPAGLFLRDTNSPSISFQGGRCEKWVLYDGPETNSPVAREYHLLRNPSVARSVLGLFQCNSAMRSGLGLYPPMPGDFSLNYLPVRVVDFVEGKTNQIFELVEAQQSPPSDSLFAIPAPLEKMNVVIPQSTEPMLPKARPASPASP